MEKDILLVSHRPEATGKGLYAQALGRTLANNGELRVALRTNHSHRLDNFFHRTSNIPPAVRMQEFLSALNQFSLMATIPQGYDVYHFTSEILSVFARNHRPSVITVHDVLAFTNPSSYGRTSSKVYQFIYRHVRYADRVICVSEKAQSDLLKCLGGNFDPDKTKVIHPGVDHRIFKPRGKDSARRLLGLPERERIILHVGTEEPRKNIPTLLRAFAEVHRKIPDTLLVRIGTPSLPIRDIITDLGIKEQVIYLRPDSILLPHVYNAADAFVFPSLSEGFGFPLLEAMSSGCPVLASDSSPMDSIVMDSGILFPPQDALQLATLISELLLDDDQRAHLGKLALERSSSFSWERCAKETFAIYEEIS